MILPFTITSTPYKINLSMAKRFLTKLSDELKDEYKLAEAVKLQSEKDWEGASDLAEDMRTYQVWVAGWNVSFRSTKVLLIYRRLIAEHFSSKLSAQTPTGLTSSPTSKSPWQSERVIVNDSCWWIVPSSTGRNIFRGSTTVKPQVLQAIWENVGWTWMWSQGSSDGS